MFSRSYHVDKSTILWSGPASQKLDIMTLDSFLCLEASSIPLILSNSIPVSMDEGGIGAPTEKLLAARRISHCWYHYSACLYNLCVDAPMSTDSDSFGVLKQGLQSLGAYNVQQLPAAKHKTSKESQSDTSLLRQCHFSHDASSSGPVLLDSHRGTRQSRSGWRRAQLHPL